ncbi:outer membrane fimbrial usher protein HifC [Advenella mimigardefordensis DPN7]|uniref:Outer membrane fimbrial usher protein HifC n=1 Tax=Advenella mimigardefordensis (strain DSM 17166 / LMG 22922 / DPN7) TaxID=1247726 RepID=W0PH59_ADVMD|nr:outer membrane fimbrial usher protein HifC [Advenella mimigardefordensis DPN7]
MCRYFPTSSTYVLFFSLLYALSTQPAAGQQRVEFDEAFLRGAARHGLDVSRFAQHNRIPPGEYESDIYVNNVWKGKTRLHFRELNANGATTLCLSDVLLRILDLDPARLSYRNINHRETPCMAAAEAIPQATFSYRLDDLRLNVDIAQIYVRQRPRGYISPDNWQTGVPTAFLNYDYNFYQTTMRGGNRTYNARFLHLNGGINLGNWHYRHQGSLSWGNMVGNDENEGSRYRTYANYLQRDIPLLKSQIMLGDFITNNVLFDTLSLRGVQLFSDDRMLPDSVRGYAPAVRGIAQSNALVTIRQNANIISETSVPPGPFEINDLYPSSYGGDLHVTITEANGSARTFIVPFNTMSRLLRPGGLKYHFAAGRLKLGQDTLNNRVIQSSLQYGVNNWLTVNAGVSVSERFRSLLFGGAFNTSLGAFGFDMISSRTSLRSGERQAGVTWRATYSHFVPATKSNIALTAAHYSSNGYHSIVSAALQDNQDGSTRRFRYLPDRQKNQLQLTWNQPFADRWGSAYLTAYTNDYWNRSGRDTTVQAGYSNSYRNISYTLSVSRTRDYYTAKSSNHVFLSFSIPIGKTGNHTLTTQAGNQTDNGSYVSSMLAGSFGNNNAYAYAATASHGSGSTSGSINGTYRSSYGLLSASAGVGKGYRQFGVSASGAAIVHPKGISFSEQVGNTFAIISAPGAEGARVAAGTNTRLDANGIAVVPYLNPYQINTVGVDPLNAGRNVDFEATSYQVIPRANGTMLVELKTKTGRGVLFQITLADGTFPPLGTDVLDEQGNTVGFVAQQGYVFARGPQQTGALFLRWGSAESAQCKASYALEQTTDSGKGASDQLIKVKVQCH